MPCRSLSLAFVAVLLTLPAASALAGSREGSSVIVSFCVVCLTSAE